MARSKSKQKAGPKGKKWPSKYKKSYLSRVIARVDFAEPLAIPLKGLPERVISSLKRQFPVPERHTKVVKSVTLKLRGESEETTTEVREWHFYSKSRHKKIVITETSMSVEYSKYNRFNTLQKDFLGLVDVLFETFEEVQVNRLGLRYIDNIDLTEPKPTMWDKYLIGDMLAMFNLPDDRKTIARAFHVLEMCYDDESRLRFQYGMPNPDFPAPIKRKLFVLDCDVYCTILLSQGDVSKFLDLFHDKARKAFEAVITDGLRQKMGAVYD